jgi:hypothetical protein
MALQIHMLDWPLNSMFPISLSLALIQMIDNAGFAKQAVP